MIFVIIYIKYLLYSYQINYLLSSNLISLMSLFLLSPIISNKFLMESQIQAILTFSNIYNNSIAMVNILNNHQ